MKNKLKIVLIGLFLLTITIASTAPVWAGSIDGIIYHNTNPRYHTGTNVTIDADTVQGEDVVAWLVNVESELDDLADTDDDLQDQIDNLQNQINTAIDRIENNELDIKDMQDIISDIQDELADLESTDEDLQDQIDDVVQDLIDSGTELNNRIDGIWTYLGTHESKWGKDDVGIKRSQVEQIVQPIIEENERLRLKIDLLTARYTVLERALVDSGLFTRSELNRLTNIAYLDNEANDGTTITYRGRQLTKNPSTGDWQELHVVIVETGSYELPEPIVEETVNETITETNETINETTNETAE